MLLVKEVEQVCQKNGNSWPEGEQDRVAGLNCGEIRACCRQEEEEERDAYGSPVIWGVKMRPGRPRLSHVVPSFGKT